ELAGPEDEVPRRNLVAERLPDLRDPEGHFLAGGVEHVQVVDVNALRRLSAEIDDRRLVLHQPQESLEHEIEEARFGQRTLAAAHGTLSIRLARCPFDAGIVSTK